MCSALISQAITKGQPGLTTADDDNLDELGSYGGSSLSLITRLRPRRC